MPVKAPHYDDCPLPIDRRPLLSERSTDELRALAANYRAMAGTASTEDVVAALLRIASRLDALVEQRQGADRSTSRQAEDNSKA